MGSKHILWLELRVNKSGRYLAITKRPQEKRMKIYILEGMEANGLWRMAKVVGELFGTVFTPPRKRNVEVSCTGFEEEEYRGHC